MITSTPARRYRRLKTVLTVLAAILSVPIILAMMVMGAAGERR